MHDTPATGCDALTIARDGDRCDRVGTAPERRSLLPPARSVGKLLPLWLLIWQPPKSSTVWSRSPRLAQDISRYRMLHRGINKLSTTVEALQQAMAEHEAILKALDARNAKASHAAMIDHLQEWQAYFVRHFSSDRTSDTPPVQP